MKIGMILDNTFPPDPRVENEAITLIQNGHEVFLFCFDYTGKLQQNELIKGINVCRRKVSRLEYKLSALAYTFPFYHKMMQKDIEEFANRNHIEAFHIHDIQIAKSVFEVNKKLNLPTVLDLHENRPEIMKYYDHVKSFPGKALIYPSRWKKAEFYFLKKADRVIVVTDEAKLYYAANTSAKMKKFFVVPNSVRTSFYTNYNVSSDIREKNKNSFNILYLGDTGLRRGLETAIESLIHLTPSIPNIKLTIVGTSKTQALLEKKVKELQLEEFVEFTGWQSPDLFQSYIISSEIGICPLHRNVHHDTTYANKIFQFLAFGKPIIVSNAKAQAKLINKYKCGLVFTERDSKELAERVLDLYKNRGLYNTLSKNGKAAIEKQLNWEKTSMGLIKLYNGI